MMNIFKAFGLKKSDEERPFVERRKKPIDQLLAPHLDEQNIPWHWAREASDEDKAAIAALNEKYPEESGGKKSWYHPEHNMILPWKPENVAEEDLQEY